jgi:TolB-like protein
MGKRRNSLRSLRKVIRDAMFRGHVKSNGDPSPDRKIGHAGVLPFRNISSDPEQEYFADGIVEDIIAGLARIKWLFRDFSKFERRL